MANKMKCCPLCGKTVYNSFPDVYELEDGTWHLIHFCYQEEDELRACIQIFGKTKKEVEVNIITINPKKLYLKH